MFNKTIPQLAARMKDGKKVTIRQIYRAMPVSCRKDKPDDGDVLVQLVRYALGLRQREVYYTSHCLFGYLGNDNLHIWCPELWKLYGQAEAANNRFGIRGKGYEQLMRYLQENFYNSTRVVFLDHSIEP